MLESNQEVDGRFVYHGRLCPSIVDLFKSNVLLSSLGDAVTAPQEVFGDECPDPSPAVIVLSVLMAAGAD